MHGTFAEAVGAGTFGRRVRILRAARDITIDELARESGVDAVTIMRVQRDRSKPQRRTVEKLAQALGVPPEALTD